MFRGKNQYRSLAKGLEKSRLQALGLKEYEQEKVLEFLINAIDVYTCNIWGD